MVIKGGDIMLNNEGSTLAAVVMISGILLIITFTFSTFVVADVKQSVRQQQNVEAHYIAMAGANATCKGIMLANELERREFANLKFPIKSVDKTFGEGSFTVTIDEDPSQLIIESVGRVESGKDGCVEATVIRTLKKEVILPASGRVPFAIYAKGHTSIAGRVDGSIATSSSAQPAVTIEEGIMKLKDGGGKSTIYLPKNSDPEKSIEKPHWWEMSSEAEVTDVAPEGFPVDIGALKDMYPEPKLPDFPSNLPKKGNITLSGTSGTKTISGDGYYEEISVEGSKTLVIDTKDNDITIIRVAKLNLNRADRTSSTIDVIGNGKVFIYVDNVINFAGTVRASNPENITFYIDASNIILGGDIEVEASLYFGNTYVTISGSCTVGGNIIVSQHGSINLEGAGDIYLGVIYAPNANVMVTGSGTVVGAIIGNNVTLAGDSNIVYDGSGQLQTPIDTSDKEKIIYKEGYWK